MCFRLEYFCVDCIQSCKDFYLNWMMKGEDILTIYYKDLKDLKKLEYNLKGVVNFMKIANDAEMLKCEFVTVLIINMICL